MEQRNQALQLMLRIAKVIFEIYDAWDFNERRNMPLFPTIKSRITAAHILFYWPCFGKET